MEQMLAGSTLNVPSPLVCEMLPMATLFWDQSPALSRRIRPDICYLWNLAVRALHEDFSAPDIQTLQAALLDLSGRPIYSIIGNSINMGRTVALAYSLGINRDPTTWDLPQSKRNLRIRLWWGVLIHDYW
jgi:hypothetical protein